MGATATQVLGASLAFLGLVGAIVCTASNEWRITSRARSLMTASWVSHGLWRQCTANAMGSVQCKPNLTILDLEGADDLVRHRGRPGRPLRPLRHEVHARRRADRQCEGADVALRQHCLHAVRRRGAHGRLLLCTRGHRRLLRPPSHRSQVRVRLWALRGLDRVVSAAAGRGASAVRRLSAAARIVRRATPPRVSSRLPGLRQGPRGAASRPRWRGPGAFSRRAPVRRGGCPARRAQLRAVVKEQRRRRSRAPPPEERLRVSRGHEKGPTPSPPP